jgi:hypothetical protein
MMIDTYRPMRVFRCEDGYYNGRFEHLDAVINRACQKIEDGGGEIISIQVFLIQGGTAEAGYITYRTETA